MDTEIIQSAFSTSFTTCMPFLDITNQFRTVVREKENEIPENKRRKLTKSTPNDKELPLGKEFIAEAYTVLSHINTLTKMLANIRKPYLNVDSRSSPLTRQTSRIAEYNESDLSWASNRHLTNEERDQIDLQTRVILTRCADRIKAMEALEQRRVELIAKRTNPLTRLLPARLRQDESTVLSDFIAAHHSSVIWYLSRRITKASQAQQDMQEERVKRQLERSRSLGSSAARDAQYMDTRLSSKTHIANTGGSWLGGASSSIIAATIGVPANYAESSSSVSQTNSSFASDEEDDEIELTASQIMQFEAENENILRSVQDTLESVQQAESRLMDISALQMELVTHLTKQTELTDQLYEDAIATTSNVEKGNVQLQEAKRRAKDGRLFMLIFLIGASLSLLFLHYY